ncbi:MAG: AsmA-like C-terminal domain-containing protein [Desulfuromusa sp.]|nr:AsmA-like C-terminal domain-containing protein [Desulfuromusa sp.]
MNLPSARPLTRIVCYLLIFLATIIALLIVFLSQLDINNYHISLERQLSSALNQPVKIAHSSLTFNRGLALVLTDLQIGPDHAILADIPHIAATLKIAPLFDGQFILDQVRVNNPKLQLHLPFPERPTEGTSQRLINSLGIRILSVHNGNLKIYQKQDDDIVQQLELANLHAILRGWKPEKTGQLVISGQLREQGADFLFETSLPSSRNPEVWRTEEFKTQLKVTNLSTDKFPKLQGQSFPESLDLNLSLKGIPAKGTNFNATLSGADNNERFFSLAGRWTSSSQQESITKLTGELLKIPLHGEFYLIRQAKKHFLAGRFGAENVVLNPERLQAWRIPNAEKLIRGELDRLVIILDKSWNPAEETLGLPRIGAEVTICNLDWNAPELEQLQDLSVELSLENKILHIKNGILIADDQLIDFSGTIASPFLHPQIDLKFIFNPLINDFISQLNLPEDWSISGNMPGSLSLNGPLFSPDFQLQTDLSSTKFQLGTLFQKQPTDRGTLKLRGQFANNRLQLDQFSFNLDDLNISGAGYFQQIQGEQKYHLAVEPIHLGKLKSFSPLLQQLQIKGIIEPVLSQQQAGLQGTLWLKDVGAHLTSVIGDLNKTSGEVNLDQHGFTFQNLKASLGKSDFIVTGVFSDWQNPQLNLDLSGKKVRAQDLVFSNQQLTLYDLDGHLQINADGINFSPVKVRLEENTLATVNGKVSNFSDPQVSLDIQSDQVDVLDIINLFVDPETTGPREQGQEGPPLLIKVSAKQGTLGGLIFQNVEALIRGDNNRLTIFPLTFNNEEGWCQTRVEFDYSQEIAPLTVSGHVVGINASVLHQDMFEKPGLINGQLSGDFYIEGDPGNDRFWQEARGGIHIQVTDGTLRKFHGLAKVFSLLNVSQIFAGKLPNMDKEGMPFSLLEGSFQIGAGQLKTEDLKITSEAMNLSMVGTQGLIDDTLDFTLGVMPLRTVDKIITSIPIAGWVLAGEDKALITAHFKIEGTSENPRVTAVPIDSVSKTVFGIFKRTLGLPVKMVKDIGSLFKKEPEKKIETE